MTLRRPAPRWTCALSATASLVLLLAPACDRDSNAYINAETPIAVGERLVVPLTEDGQLLVLDVGLQGVAGVRFDDLGGTLELVTPLRDSEALLILGTDDDDHDHLTQLPADGSTPTTWPLDAFMTRLALPPDEDVVVVWRPETSGDAQFINPNELVLIDLDSGDATPWTLASLGHDPSRVVVTDVTGPLRYVFGLSRNHVAILGITPDGDIIERSVPLTDPAGGPTRTPIRLRFAEDPSTGTPWALVTTAEGNSAYALRIDASADDFSVVVSQLAGISTGADAALVPMEDDALAALMLNPYSGAITLTDVATGVGTTVPIEGAPTTLQLLDRADGPYALLHGSDGLGTFHMVDLWDLAAVKGKAIRSYAASARIDEIFEAQGGASFVVFHDDDEAGVSVVDAETDRITTFSGTGRVGSWRLDDDQSGLLMLTHGSYSGSDSLVRLDLVSLHPESVLVEPGADSLHILEPSGTLITWRDSSDPLMHVWSADPTTSDPLVVPGVLWQAGLNQWTSGGWP